MSNSEYTIGNCQFCRKPNTALKYGLCLKCNEGNKAVDMFLNLFKQKEK